MISLGLQLHWLQHHTATCLPVLTLATLCVLAGWQMWWRGLSRLRLMS